MKLSVRCLMLSFVMFPWCVYGDEVEEQIQLGIQAYQSGRYAEAIEELQFAVSQVQDLLNDQYLELLPEPPEGWQAQAGEAQTTSIAMMGGGTHLVRDYVRGDEQITVEMMANSPMLAALNVVLNNPAMLAGSPDTRPFRYKGYKGVKKNPQSGNVEISLLVGANTLVQLKGTRLEDPETLDVFLGAMDFEAIKTMIAGG